MIQFTSIRSLTISAMVIYVLVQMHLKYWENICLFNLHVQNSNHHVCGKIPPCIPSKSFDTHLCPLALDNLTMVMSKLYIEVMALMFCAMANGGKLALCLVQHLIDLCCYFQRYMDIPQGATVYHIPWGSTIVWMFYPSQNASCQDEIPFVNHKLIDTTCQLISTILLP